MLIRLVLTQILIKCNLTGLIITYIQKLRIIKWLNIKYREKLYYIREIKYKVLTKSTLINLRLPKLMIYINS
jgi:hypothetical protein